MKPSILIASKNPDKADEIRMILQGLPFKILDLSGCEEIASPEETGLTFRENALIKVHYYYKAYGIPVIADDSGLVVETLGGQPGIHSARYAGINGDYAANNQKLLRQMAGFKKEKRTAFFICFAAYFDGSDTIESEGRVEGLITESERGQNGFGYDPLFYYPPLGKTFAELDLAEKNKISHRKKAFEILSLKLRNI